MELEIYKQNPKTSFLAGMYEKLLREEESLLETIQSDPSLQELADDDLKQLSNRKDELLKQMDGILAAEKEGEEFLREVVLKARAGAGGEEAALFAGKLAEM